MKKIENSDELIMKKIKKGDIEYNREMVKQIKKIFAHYSTGKTHAPITKIKQKACLKFLKPYYEIETEFIIAQIEYHEANGYRYQELIKHSLLYQAALSKKIHSVCGWKQVPREEWKKIEEECLKNDQFKKSHYHSVMYPPCEQW